MARLFALVGAALASAILGGCLGSSPGEAAGEGPPAAAEGPSRFERQVRFLAANGSLVPEVPEAGSVLVDDFFGRWATRTGSFPEWAGSLGNGTHLLSPRNASLTLWFTTDLPVLQVPEFPDVAAWLGVHAYKPIVGSVRLSGPLLSGSPLRVEVPLANVPELQPDLVVDPRWSVSLLVTVTMSQLQAHNVRLLVGGDTPSALEFEAATVSELPPSVRVEGFPIGGSLPLFERVVGGVLLQEGLNFHAYPFTLAGNATGLVMAMRTRSGTTADVDVTLADSAGRTVTWGVSPRPDETFYLWGEGLAPFRGQELVLGVYHHVGVALDYMGFVVQYGPGAGATY